MRRYFTRERFGRPQFLAGLLLLAFLAQGLWLLHAELSASQVPEGQEALRIGEGLKQWHGRGVAGAPIAEPAETIVRDPFRSEDDGFDIERSPFLYLVTSGPLMAWPRSLD